MDFAQKVEAELRHSRQVLENTQSELDWAIDWRKGKVSSDKSNVPSFKDGTPQQQKRHFLRLAQLETAIFDAIERLHIAESKPARLRCIACKDRFEAHDLAVAPCDDTYCKPCAETFLTSSFEGQIFRSAKCCGYTFDINNKTNRDILGDDLARKYLDKQAEMEDPNRTYCAKPTCSTWIRPETITDNVGTCSQPECLTTTCSLCKAAAHIGSACCKDEAWSLLLETANIQKWQTCPGCKAIVEWESECYSMTCLCGTVFCYLCGVEYPEGDQVCICPHSPEAVGDSDSDYDIDRLENHGQQQGKKEEDQGQQQQQEGEEEERQEELRRIHLT